MEQVKTEEDHGRLYWLVRHSVEWFGARLKARPWQTGAATIAVLFAIPLVLHPKLRVEVLPGFALMAVPILLAHFGMQRLTIPAVAKRVALAIFIAVLAFIDRPGIQEFVLSLRIHFLPVIAPLLVLGLLYWAYKKLKGKIHVPWWPKWKWLQWKLVRLFLRLVMLAVLVSGAVGYIKAYNYLDRYVRYATLPIENLAALPTTDHERVQPLHAIKSAAYNVRGNTWIPTYPNYIRNAKGNYVWTLAFQPTYLLVRLERHVLDQVFTIPATQGVISFGSQNLHKVRFDIGNSLMFSHNVNSCSRKEFGFWRLRFFSDEPSDPMYLQDGSGKMVTVIPLIRWVGVFFPRPNFDGVIVVPQMQHHSVGRYFTLVFRGCGGYWVPPSHIKDYPFLKGQNLVPQSVTRYMASSFRYHAGFLAPMPGYHVDDIRIPDIPGDMNNEPFVGFYRLPGQKTGKVYQNFAMEPYDAALHGFALGILVPGDGIGPILTYHTHGVIGPSAVGAIVMNSNNRIDSTNHRPVENRPFIHDICGKVRFMWTTTVVTFSKDGSFAGGLPPNFITEGKSKAVYPVHSSDSSRWPAEVSRQMCGAK